MSAETPPDSSERSRSLKREPGQQSERAVVYERPSDGGERVRLAKDVDPIHADSITVSEPDGHAYEDAPPGLPIAGSGERYESCGEDVPLKYCEDCGSPTWVGNTCRRSRCPRCWQSWVFQRGIEAATAVDGTRRKRQYERSGHQKNHHVVISPSAGITFNSEDPADRLMEAGKILLGHVNADTGYLVYHPWRIKPEYRGEVRGHNSGEGDMQWKDILDMPPEERGEYLVHSPHLHAFVVSENVQTETVAPALSEETGMVIHRITQSEESNVSLYDMEDLVAAVAYSLSHAGLSVDSAADGSTQVKANTFGETAQIERRESVRSEAEAAMREVAGDVLGVSFRKRSCQEPVSDGPERGDMNNSEDSDDSEDLPLSVQALTNADESETPEGGAPEASVAMTSPPSPDELGSGSSDDFGFGSSGGPEARGVPSLQSADGDMDGSDHEDHGHEEETEVCGGDLVGMWTAPESLDDDEWRESIGSKMERELRDALDEWRDLGEPRPEDLAPDEPPGEPPPD